MNGLRFSEHIEIEETCSSTGIDELSIHDILYFVDRFRRVPEDKNNLKRLLVILLYNLDYLQERGHIEDILDRIVVGRLIGTYNLFNVIDHDEGGQDIEPDYRLLAALKLAIECHADTSGDEIYKEFIGKVEG